MWTSTNLWKSFMARGTSWSTASSVLPTDRIGDNVSVVVLCTGQLRGLFKSSKDLYPASYKVLKMNNKNI